MKHKLIRLMAYLYMPLIFTLLGYSLAYIVLSPVYEMLQAVGSMVIVQEIPNFDLELKSIYEATAPKDSLLQDQVESSEEQLQLSDDRIAIDTIVFPDYETEYASLSCERIGFDSPVYWGDTKQVLKVGAGQSMGSFLPGFGKTILLSAHNTTFFKPLQKVEVGDIIIYNTNYGRFEYKVSEIEILYVTDATIKMKKLLSIEEEKLIMYTCYPFETLVGTKMDRLFVYADKIFGPVIE